MCSAIVTLSRFVEENPQFGTQRDVIQFACQRCAKTETCAAVSFLEYEQLERQATELGK